MITRALSAAPRRALFTLLPLMALGCASGGAADRTTAVEPDPPAAPLDPAGEQEGPAAHAEASNAAPADPAEEPSAPEKKAAAPLTQTQLREEAHRVVDDWHQSASVADRDRYLGHFAPDAVFLGTDPEERWDLSSFTAYVDTYFAPPYQGWTFEPSDRHVALGLNSEIAWFDEKLSSKKYGSVRGTGVLRRVGDSWKLSHYSMTLAVPNGAMDAVREAIVSFEAVSR